MAGTASARPLTRPRRDTARFEMSLATPGDDADVRRLLREHAFPGNVAVTLEREPDSRLAATIEGDVHQTLVARERRTGRIAAIASRSVHNAFVNGRPARLGYLGQLRVAKPFTPSRTLLDAGFAFCRTLHLGGDARFYLTSIVEDNEPAKRLLLGFFSECAPQFTAVGTVNTLVMTRAAAGRCAAPAGVAVRRATADMLPDIVRCLARNGRRHQFARNWTTDDLSSAERARGLSASDFHVAVRGTAVAGCVAVWDQRPYKQAVVRAYSPMLQRSRWLVNAVAPFAGLTPLPPVGRRFEFAYLSHLAVDDDCGTTALALLSTACAALPAGVDHVVTGLADDSPMLTTLTQRLRPRLYRSVLYAVCWADGERDVAGLDGRVPHPEVAVL